MHKTFLDLYIRCRKMYIDALVLSQMSSTRLQRYNRFNFLTATLAISLIVRQEHLTRPPANGPPPILQPCRHTVAPAHHHISDVSRGRACMRRVPPHHGCPPYGGASHLHSLLLLELNIIPVLDTLVDKSIEIEE
jgi:hypothetical protein